MTDADSATPIDPVRYREMARDIRGFHAETLRGYSGSPSARGSLRAARGLPRGGARVYTRARVGSVRSDGCIAR